VAGAVTLHRSRKSWRRGHALIRYMHLIAQFLKYLNTQKHAIGSRLGNPTDRGLKAGLWRTRGRLALNRARGENVDEPQRPSQGLLKQQSGSSQPSCLIRTSSHAHRISIEERPAGHLSPSDDSGIYREVSHGAVECHLRAMPTPSRMTVPNSTRTLGIFTRAHPLGAH
jgi:hypothetical protein